jgi:hypothetical protein
MFIAGALKTSDLLRSAHSAAIEKTATGPAAAAGKHAYFKGRDTPQGGLRTNCTPDRAEPSWPYFQAGGLCQIDLILVEGQQLSCFEMDCRGHMKNVQQSVASGHCET